MNTNNVHTSLFKGEPLNHSTQQQLKEFQKSNADCGLQGVCQVTMFWWMHSNCTADQYICFRYTGRKIPLLLVSKISTCFCACPCRFVSDLLRKPHCWLGSQGELIVYPCSGVSPSTIFSYETARPIKAKLYMKHLQEGGTNVYINNAGHVTKMAAMPIYGKNLQKSSSELVDRFQRNLA